MKRGHTLIAAALASARMPAADTNTEEEVARRTALATKGARGQSKSKGTPAALRSPGTAFALAPACMARSCCVSSGFE